MVRREVVDEVLLAELLFEEAFSRDSLDAADEDMSLDTVCERLRLDSEII